MDLRTIKAHAHFLSSTLIPDLQASGHECTAQDLQEAALGITYLQSPEGVQEAATNMSPAERRNLIEVLKRTLK